MIITRLDNPDLNHEDDEIENFIAELFETHLACHIFYGGEHLGFVEHSGICEIDEKTLAVIPFRGKSKWFAVVNRITLILNFYSNRSYRNLSADVME